MAKYYENSGPKDYENSGDKKCKNLCPRKKNRHNQIA